MEVSRTFNRSSSPVFGVKDSVNAAALVFALTAPDQYVPQVVETHRGFVVLQLKEKTEASQEEFEKQKSDMMAAVRAQKQAEALADYVTGLKSRAKLIKIDPTYATPASDDDGEEKKSG
jgi:peptidyl-prolyl cis-trans isomerase D